MTETVLGLPTAALSADKIRSTPADLRQCLASMAERGRDVWTGPLDEVTSTLFDVARIDLCLARLVEGHCDALRIIDQAGADPQYGAYGVWASRSVGTGLTGAHMDGRWVLSGELRFASGVDLIDRALVPVRVGEDDRQLIDVPADLGTSDPRVWRTSGMDSARTFTIRLEDEATSARLVGPPNFYLERPGFAVGGLCVAAVWAGGAQQVLEVVAAGVRDFPTTPHQLRRLGVIEEAAWSAALVLRSTVARLPDLGTDETRREIDLARTSVVSACETALTEAPVIVGPAGLSRNVRLARLLQDLAIYIRQHHVDGVLTALGEQALKTHQPLAG